MVSTESYQGQHLEAAAELKKYYQWIIGAVWPYSGGCGTEYGPGIGTVDATRKKSFIYRHVWLKSSRERLSLARRLKDR